MSDTGIDAATYINLRSYKRDGNPVDTPVWQAPLDGKLMVFTDGTSFKVKRIGRNPRVQVARCDVRGKLLGPWLDGSCELVEVGSELEREAYRVLTGKYGLLMRLGTVFSTLAGRAKRRRVLRIALDGVHR